MKIILVIAIFLCVVCAAWFRDKSSNGRHAWRRKSAEKALAKINSFTGEHSQQQTFAYLRQTDPFVFEEMLLSAFQKYGFKIIRNRRYTGDGGIDGQIIINGRRIPLQAKRYTGHIQLRHVQDFARIIDNRKAPFGLFCHTGRTGKGAYQSACNEGKVWFISGDTLIRLLQGDKTLMEEILSKMQSRHGKCNCDEKQTYGAVP